MQREEIVRRAEGWDPDDDIDLAGILITISAIAKRLAKMLLEHNEKGGKRNEPFE